MLNDLEKIELNYLRSLVNAYGAVIEHRNRIVREKSASEAKQHYQQPGHGLFFCLHEKHYFSECAACRRDKREAASNFERFMNRNNAKQGKEK